ncbi:hypothetical protein HDU67_008338 [Dinochytrium kinnereticum]|nr:hypothetical protein HDU67_008338 [Dinochytrium kinnereticum]
MATEPGSLYVSRPSPWSLNQRIDFTLEVPASSLDDDTQVSLVVSISPTSPTSPTGDTNSSNVICTSTGEPQAATCRNRALNVGRNECLVVACRNAVVAPDLLDPVAARYAIRADWCPQNISDDAGCLSVSGGAIQIAGNGNSNVVTSSRSIIDITTISVAISPSTSSPPSPSSPSSPVASPNSPSRTLQTGSPRGPTSPTSIPFSAPTTAVLNGNSDESVITPAGISQQLGSREAITGPTIALIAAGSIVGFLLLIAVAIFYRKSKRDRRLRSDEVVHNLYSANGAGKPTYYGGRPADPVNLRDDPSVKRGDGGGFSSFLTRFTGRKKVGNEEMMTLKFPSKPREEEEVGEPQHPSYTKKSVTVGEGGYQDLPKFSDSAMPQYQQAEFQQPQFGPPPPQFTFDPYAAQTVPFAAYTTYQQAGYVYPQYYPTDQQQLQQTAYPGYYDEAGVYHWYETSAPLVQNEYAVQGLTPNVEALGIGQPIATFPVEGGEPILKPAEPAAPEGKV